MSETKPLVGDVKNLIGAADNKQARKVGKDLDKDAFLQLLVAQLKHQDPMKPMDDTSFIAEMAQFSSLEQMQNLNKLMESQQTFQSLTQASGMIGKYVVLQMPGEDAQLLTGQVSEVRSSGGKVSVVIDGHEFDASYIRQVSDKAFPTATAAPASSASGSGSAGSSASGSGSTAGSGTTANGGTGT